MNTESLITAVSSQQPLFGAGILQALIVIALAVVVLKGFALWTAAQKNAKVWFWVLMFVNTLGILDALYLFVFSKKK